MLVCSPMSADIVTDFPVNPLQPTDTGVMTPTSAQTAPAAPSGDGLSNVALLTSMTAGAPPLQPMGVGVFYN